MSKILCDNTTAWLLFLANLIRVTLSTDRLVVPLIWA
jgi:hypothetical protein